MRTLENNLNKLQTFVDELQSTSSSNSKKETLKKYSNDHFITKVLRYTFDSFKKYNVTPTLLKKRLDLCKNPGYYDIFYLLDALDQRTITGHSAVAAVNGFINPLVDNHKELIYNIIDRNIKGRVSTTLINKVIPGLIPTFDVALADKYDPKYVDFENENWFASRKLDGVRCLIRKEGNEITAYSRQGKEFETLKNVKDDIAKIPGDFVFDGEICLMDEDGNEDFQGIMKQIRRKDHTIENPKYIIFDCLTLEEFDTKKGSKSLFWRLDRISINYSIYKYISLLNQDLVDDNEELLEMTKQAEISGYEGLMLRKDCGYQGKRTRNLLKVKKMNDAEYKVVDATYGPFRHVKDGKEIESIVLSAVIIEHKGNKVNVGSGFSFDQRKLFIQHPDEIIGKTITVQYFEESKNQNGEYSLRFPVVKCIYKNGRDV